MIGTTRYFRHPFSAWHLILLLFFIAGAFSCKKEWLDAKSNKASVVPASTEDFQALLDNTGYMNRSTILGETSADNYYLDAAVLPALNTADQNAYKWVPDLFAGTSSPDWSRTYQEVFYSNVVLEGIEKADPGNSPDAWNNVKGTALFSRAYSFFQLVDEFSKVYDPATAATDLGIPLRLHSDPVAPSTRATIAQTYDQVLADLIQAVPLLPVTAKYITRPSKAAAFGMIAKVYLNMAVYDKALLYADSALRLRNQLINFSSLNGAALYPFSAANPEVIYYTDAFSTVFFAGLANADTLLYQSYNTNDLRRSLFYTGTPARFRGNYTGSFVLFSGIATDEMYLVRAEAFARTGNAAKAMDDLNTLLATRWSGPYTPMTATGAADALAKVLVERRKELAFRIGRRWSDLKRFNRDGAAITLRRILGSQTYTLLPNDKLYVLPIPDDEIRISGIPQNPR